MMARREEEGRVGTGKLEVAGDGEVIDCEIYMIGRCSYDVPGRL